METASGRGRNRLVESLVILAGPKEDGGREDGSQGSEPARAVLALAPTTVGHDEVASKIHLEYGLSEDGGGALLDVVLLVGDHCEGERPISSVLDDGVLESEGLRALRRG